MSLQNIQLTPLIINELYRDLLVDIRDGSERNYVPAMHQEPAPPEVQITPAGRGTTPHAAVQKEPSPAPASASKTPAQESGPRQKKTPTTAPETDTILSAPVPVEPVQQTASKADAPADPSSRIKFLGGNKKRIAFIVNSSTDVYLPDAELEWLGKMLEACRLNLGDIAIANTARNAFTIADIRKELFSTTVILLGSEPSAIQLPINFPQFSLQSHDGIVFLATPPPSQLILPTPEAKLLKSKLWVCLQKLFKLS